jgi:colanic acid biosynthesis glycosyl transferase WcaI
MLGAMRILICGINFLPEPVGIGKYTGEMALWLAARGHTVRAISAPPYYPDWRVAPGYSGAKYARDTVGGVELIRAPLWVPKQPRGLTSLLHLGSFAATSAPLVAAQLAWKPDAVFAVAPALFCAPAGLALARATGALSCLHIQDFEIDAAFDLGLIRNRSAESLARGAEAKLFGAFDWVSTISPRMLERLEQKGVPPERCVLFPNWVDCDQIYRMSEPSPYRAELNVAADTTIVMYSGALGEKQGIEIIIEAAQLLRDNPKLLFVVGGAGPAFRRFQSLSAHLPNIRCLGLAPVEALNAWLNVADIHLVPQRADVADLVMPSKLTGMLASGRPIVATAAEGTQVAELVKRCGRVVAPGATRDLVAELVALADKPRVRERLGKAARDIAEGELAKDKVLAQFEIHLAEAVERHRAARRRGGVH